MTRTIWEPNHLAEPELIGRVTAVEPDLGAWLEFWRLELWYGPNHLPRTDIVAIRGDLAREGRNLSGLRKRRTSLEWDGIFVPAGAAHTFLRRLRDKLDSPLDDAETEDVLTNSFENSERDTRERPSILVRTAPAKVTGSNLAERRHVHWRITAPPMVCEVDMICGLGCVHVEINRWTGPAWLKRELAE